MTAPTFETVWQLVVQLPESDQQRLRDELNRTPNATIPTLEPEPNLEAILGDLIIPQWRVHELTAIAYRQLHGLAPDAPVEWSNPPSIEQVHQATAGIPYDHSLSDEVIAMRYEEE